ncbi:MAG: SAM-dependent methyltransferase [Bacteroidales bacterium]|nr:SAM-dependent methyltransferase [Bacteroidales bacterium]MBN2819285.1 SAM-dependent methyltransferase [Bacteroidales bacterium]
MKGKLYLIPATIGESDKDLVIPIQVQQVVNNIRYYIVENERTARRQLIQYGIQIPIDDLHFFELNKHTDRNQISKYLKPCEQEDVGLLSEAGVPAVADPGSEIVELAHKQNIKVVPLVGPSSILLALMASGLNGQSFTFHGYLPVKPTFRIKKIKELEQQANRNNQTQIFIEAPYRNNQLLEDLIKHCSNSIKICIACHITQEDELIKTLTVEEWKKAQKPDLHKKPTIFLTL